MFCIHSVVSFHLPTVSQYLVLALKQNGSVIMSCNKFHWLITYLFAFSHCIGIKWFAASKFLVTTFILHSLWNRNTILLYFIHTVVLFVNHAFNFFYCGHRSFSGLISHHIFIMPIHATRKKKKKRGDSCACTVALSCYLELKNSSPLKS